MANVYDKLKEMNITLPAPPPKGGVYSGHGVRRSSAVLQRLRP